MMKIGPREVVHSATLIVPEGEDAWIQFQLRSWSIKLHIEFQQDELKAGEPAPQPAAHIEGMDDHARLLLRNWSNALPTVTTVPIRLGTTDRHVGLFFMLWHTLTGGVHRVDMQFLEEAPQ